jgi:N-glycosylase/DNA lyase
MYVLSCRVSISPTCATMSLSPMSSGSSQVSALSPCALFELGSAKGVSGRMEAPLPHGLCTSSIGQTVFTLSETGAESLSLPLEHEELIPGVRWGRCDTFLTPAYWRTQAWFTDQELGTPPSYALGGTLAEEIAACLLGGHGIPAEIGLAAYHQVREQKLLNGPAPSAAEVETALREPLNVNGRVVKYRFARQRSVYLSASLRRVAEEDPPAGGDRMFRDWLATFPGFGPKTASWVTRNHRGSDAVAILDVHLHRACRIAGVFFPRHSLARDYMEMEDRFIQFAWALGVRPSRLDALIWRDMKRAGNFARDVYRFHLRHGA